MLDYIISQGISSPFALYEVKYESPKEQILELVQETSEKITYNFPKIISKGSDFHLLKVARLFANLTKTDEFRHIMDKSLYEDFFNYEDKENFDNSAIFRNEMYDVVLMNPLYVYMFLDNFPEFSLSLLEHIHSNKLLVDSNVYLAIFDSLLFSDLPHDTERFNSLMATMFVCLPGKVCSDILGHLDLKYDGFEKDLLNFINGNSYDTLKKLMKQDKMKKYKNLLMFNINSFRMLKCFMNDLTDDFIQQNITKFSLDSLKFIIGLLLENETITMIRDRMVQLDYFNPDNFRMLSKETKINYLQQYFQIEDEIVVAYTALYDDKFVLAVNGKNDETTKRIENDYFKGIYNDYEAKVYKTNYYEGNLDGMNETFMMLNMKEAYNFIKNQSFSVVEVLVDLNDIHLVRKETGEYRIVAQRAEVNELPMASQLNTLISEKYDHIDNFPAYEPLSVNITEELLKLKNNNTNTINNELVFDDYDIASLTEQLTTFIKLFAASNNTNLNTFTGYANLLMSNSKFLLDHPKHLSLFLNKCEELRYHYPIVDGYVNIIKSELSTHLDKDEKYKKSSILANIFDFKVENSDDEDDEVIVEEIEYDNKPYDIDFTIIDSPEKTMSHEMINNFIKDIKDIVEEQDTETRLISLRQLCHQYLTDGGLWKANDSILSHVLPLLNKCVDEDPFVIEYINIIQKHRQGFQTQEEVNENEVIPDICDNLVIKDEPEDDNVPLIDSEDELEMHHGIPVDNMAIIDDMYDSEDDIPIVTKPVKKATKKTKQPPMIEMDTDDDMYHSEDNIPIVTKPVKKVAKKTKKAEPYESESESEFSDNIVVDQISNFIDDNLEVPKKKLTPKKKKKIYPKKKVKKPKKHHPLKDKY